MARTGKKERYAKEEEVRARCRESYERIKRLGNKREQWLWVRMEHKEEQKRAKCQPIPLCKVRGSSFYRKQRGAFTRLS